MEQHEHSNNAGAATATAAAGHSAAFCLTEHNRLTPLADRRPKTMAKADDRNPKPVKQLRFNAEQMDADENKENFKRRGPDRKSMRGSRCLSAVVTEQERLAAMSLAGSPRMVQPGFVQSMCRFYADIRRSNTNVAGKDAAKAAAGAKKSKASPLRICVPAEASPSGSDVSSTSTSSPASPTEGRRSMRLFRSRSWSMRRKKHEERCSPSYSTKSHDSGFSDVAEAKKTAATAIVDLEDDEDPNLTQLPVANSLQWEPTSRTTEERAKSPTWSTETRTQFLSSPSLPAKSSTLPASSSSMTPSMALMRMEQSVGTVASLQEGLRLKSHMDEDKENGECRHRTTINTSNILSRSAAEAAALENKARKQFYLDEILSARTASSADVSVLSSNGGLVFSTPVRESFRKGSKNARLAAMAMARTANGAQSDHKDKRRWSNMLTADEPSPLRRERPRTIVGNDAWEHFLDFKPTSQELSTQMLSPEAETEAEYNSDVSMLPSLAVDGTATQLMVESFMQQQQDRGRRCQEIVFDPVNTLLMADDDEDTIVEMDHASTSTLHSQRSLLSSPGPVSTATSMGPVEEWWRDLHAWCEPECMTYLQSKPIVAAHRHVPVTMPSEDHEADRAVDVIKNIDADAAAIAQGIRDVNSLVVRGNLYPHMAKCVQSLSSLVSALVSESPSSTTASASPSDPLGLPGLATRRPPTSVSPEDLLESRALLLAADRLRLLAHRAQMKASTATAVVSISAVNNCLQQMSNHLNVIVASRIKYQARLLVSCLCSRDPRPSLCALVRLGNSVCSSTATDALVSEGLVSAAVQVAERALADGDEDLVVLALRAISSICSNAKCIDQFQKSHGLTLLETVLCSGVLTEASLCRRVEAAGVLAQVTSPWIDNNHKIHDIDKFVPNLVLALTGLCRSHVCEETFLLVAAALANLTFMASASVASAAMRKCHTARVLVDVVVDNEAVASLFAKDQVVTVLANLAAHAPCRQDMLSFPAPCDALSFLSRMLHTDMAVDAVGPAETAAAERVQKKAAIALSRLCHDVSVCFSVCALSSGGLVRRLVTLCTQPDERNYSDAVLVACLAVIRRVRAAGALRQQQQLQQEVDRVLGGGRSIVDSFVELSTTRADFTGHNDATNMSSSRYESYV